MRRELARLLPNLAFLALLFGGQWLLSINAPRDLAVSTVVVLAAWLLAAFAAGTVAHELGHVLAVRLAGERVLGIQLGGQLAHVTFNLGTVPVSVGIGAWAGRSASAPTGCLRCAGPSSRQLGRPPMCW
jgi:hypothetical protein